MSARTPVIGIVGTFVAAVLLTGCTTTTSGNATGVREVSNSSSTTSVQDDPEDVPTVTTPLNADRFVADPCATLSREQLADFGVTRPGVPNVDGAIAAHAGPSCVWHAREELSTIGIGFLTGNENGLADLYRMRDQDAYFEEITVSGFPAVFHSPVDSRDSGDCPLVVGISDELAFLSLEQGELDADGACDRAVKVAEEAIETIRGAA